MRTLLAIALSLLSVTAEAASKAEQSGVLRAAGVVYVATRQELLGTSLYKDLLAHGIDEVSIVDGVVVRVILLCCRDNVNKSSPLILYNPLAIKVAPGDFIEFRIGDTEAKAGTPNGLLTVTRVLQGAEQTEGKCWWEPRRDDLWMRYVFCEWMPAEGWVWQSNKLNPAWYKPAETVGGE